MLFVQLHELGHRNVVAAVGFDKDGRRVYRYTATAPDDNFNAIYDSIPMEGWWPWPRSKGTKDVSAREKLVSKLVFW